MRRGLIPPRIVICSILIVLMLQTVQSASTQPASSQGTENQSQSTTGTSTQSTRIVSVAQVAKEITTSQAYSYIDSAGNYSLMIDRPWDLIYTSPEGAVEATFSTFGVNESGTILTPCNNASCSSTTLEQNSFSVASPMLLGSTVQGVLNITYVFSSIPPLITATYSPLVNATYNMFWIVAGYNFISPNAQTFFSDTSNQVRMGTYTNATMYSSDTLNSTGLLANWGDYGPATALAASFQFDGATYPSLVVAFRNNVGTVDPTLVSSNSGNYVSTTQISFTVTAGDVVVLGVADGMYEQDSVVSVSASDTLSNSWTLMSDVIQHLTDQDSCTSTYTECSASAWIFESLITTGGSDTITVNGAYSTVGVNLYAYELTGISLAPEHISTGQGQSTSASVNSFFPSSNAFVFGMAAVFDAGPDAWSATSGFTADSTCNSAGCAEYLNGYSSGSTSCGMTYDDGSGNSNYAEICLDWCPNTGQTCATTNSAISSSTTSAAPTATLPLDVTSGDLLVVGETSSCLLSPGIPTDSLSTLFTPVTSAVQSSGSTAEEFYGVASFTGADTITGSFLSSCSSSQSVSVMEFTGPNDLLSYSTGNGGSTKSTSVSVTSYTPSSSALVVAIAASGTSTSSWTPGSGYLLSEPTSGSNVGALEYELAVSSSTTSPFSLLSPAYWSEISAAFTYVTPVTLPVKATLEGAVGSTQTVTEYGCAASPSQIQGDGSVHDVEAVPSCEVELSLPSGYIWETTGQNAISILTCSSSTCSTVPLSYVKVVEANLDPVPNGFDPTTYFENLTATTASMRVNLFNKVNNYESGNSCQLAPCTPTSGGFSFQWNMVFPLFLVHNYTTSTLYDYCTSSNSTCVPFMAQAVIEFLNNGTCQAHPQGAPNSLPAPHTLRYDFSCSNITGPGDSFEWLVDSSGGTPDSLTNIELMVNNVLEYTWYPLGANGIMSVTNAPSSVNFKDVYAQAVFAGPNSGSAYGNFFSGGGSLAFAGAENLYYNMNCVHCTWRATAEYSNTEYTAIPSSGSSFNQTFDSGVFASFLDQTSGTVSNPQYTLGVPVSGDNAEMQVSTFGSTACIEDAFETGGPSVNGTIGVYGYSSGGSSNVKIAVSTSASSSCASGSGGWTTIYSATWSSSSSPAWVPANSTSGVEYVKITASYSSGSPVLYVGGISIFSGAYGISQTHGTSGSYGAVNDPSYLLGSTAHSSYAELEVTGSASSAYIDVNFGTEYSGDLVIDGYLASGSNAYVTVAYSSTGSSWTDASCMFVNSAKWIDCGGISQAAYVEITLTYGTGTEELNLYGVYVA